MNFYLDDEWPDGAVLEVKMQDTEHWSLSLYDEPSEAVDANRRKYHYRVRLPDGTYRPVVFEARPVTSSIDTAYAGLIRLNKELEVALNEMAKLRHENTYLREALDKIRKALP